MWGLNIFLCSRIPFGDPGILEKEAEQFFYCGVADPDSFFVVVDKFGTRSVSDPTLAVFNNFHTNIILQQVETQHFKTKETTKMALLGITNISGPGWGSRHSEKFRSGSGQQR